MRGKATRKPQAAVEEHGELKERHSRSGTLVAKKSLVEAIDPTILDNGDIPSISQEAISYLNQYIRAETVLFGLRESDQLVILAAIGPETERLSGSKYQISGTVGALLATDQTKINIPNVKTDLLVRPDDGLTEGLIEIGATSILMVKVDEMGLLILAKHDLASFTSLDEAGTASVALELGYILKNVTEISSCKTHADRLEQVINSTNGANVEVDTTGGITSVLEAAVETSGADSGSFLLFDEENSSLVLAATAGLGEDTPEIRIALGDGITGWVGLHQKAICIKDSDARHVSGNGLLSSQVETAFSIPVTLGDKLIGVMNLGTSVKGRELSKENLSQTTKILGQLGLRALYDENKNRSRQALYNTVRALAMAVESRNAFNQGHAAQVSDYAVSLAAKLDLPQSQVETIKLAGLLHDIGVASLSEDLLGRERSLNNSEKLMIRQHPSHGADILHGVLELKEALPIIRHHHEHFDGTGYGDGLSQEDIPLGARILAIAEAFSGMTSTRPYRPAMSKPGALGQLIANSGTQFDPQLVHTFYELHKVTAAASQ